MTCMRPGWLPPFEAMHAVNEGPLKEGSCAVRGSGMKEQRGLMEAAARDKGGAVGHTRT
jgi:hypothetical protein